MCNVYFFCSGLDSFEHRFVNQQFYSTKQQQQFQVASSSLWLKTIFFAWDFLIEYWLFACLLASHEGCSGASSVFIGLDLDVSCDPKSKFIDARRTNLSSSSVTYRWICLCSSVVWSKDEAGPLAQRDEPISFEQHHRHHPDDSTRMKGHWWSKNVRWRLDRPSQHHLYPERFFSDRRFDVGCSERRDRWSHELHPPC